MKNVPKTVLRATVTGMVIGWLSSLVSGNLFVVLFGGSIGTLVGVILGVIHRNDPFQW